MKPLFIRLCLDEDVNVLLSDLLRARGFQVTTTQEAAQIAPAEAVADILELRKGVRLGGLKIKDLIHEGHKY